MTKGGGAMSWLGNLIFSDNEKIIFLEKRGWIVKEEKNTVARHIHGSQFEERDELVIYATNSGCELELSKAFEMEMKNKLLLE